MNLKARLYMLTYEVIVQDIKANKKVKVINDDVI